MLNHPRILLLGDYSNFHRTLATGLRHKGCNVVVASDGTRWMDTQRDVDITRPAGRLGGARLWWRFMYGDLTSVTQGNDIVVINDANFSYMRPILLKSILQRLCRTNGSVFLSAMSTDTAYLEMLEAADSPLRYSEWFIEGKPSPYMLSEQVQWQQWHSDSLVNYHHWAYDNIDGAVSALYEYHLGMVRALGQERVAYGGIPIDTSLYQPVELPDKIDKVRIFLGRDRNRKLMKGTDLLEYAAKNVVERYPDRAELVIVENRPYNEFCELLRSAHVVLDQIYSYTPATTALLAMSYGLNVVSGAEPEYYDFIEESANRPIINAPIELEPLTAALEQLVLHPEDIRSRGRASREFVVKHNDVDVVAGRFLDFWTKRIEQKQL